MEFMLFLSQLKTSFCQNMQLDTKFFGMRAELSLSVTDFVIWYRFNIIKQFMRLLDD